MTTTTTPAALEPYVGEMSTLSIGVRFESRITFATSDGEIEIYLGKDPTRGPNRFRAIIKAPRSVRIGRKGAFDE